MNKFINFLRNSTTIKTVSIIAVTYISINFIFEDRMGIMEAAITFLTFLFFVWGFNLQFWKSKRKIDREE